MPRPKGGPRFYGVATRTGGGVFKAWDEVLIFLQQHPGAEYHKRFSTERDAMDFVAERTLELTGESVVAPSTLKVAPSVAVCNLNADEDDDSPPW